MKVNTFEELDIYKRARELTKEIYTLTKYKEFSRDYGLKDQIQRSAVSIMSNIAEGFERKSNIEFMRFLFIAKDSCAEVRAQLTVALDQQYTDNTVYANLYADCKSISSMISSLIKYLSKSTKERTI
ncbi:MAG: four helix bundle protein [Candidatus Firestonebacteria bacterium RIFOXYC2_FULL_39_67]|nr:MAG: four helix bundle protein [Candidatus Firestonebacteria bacterium RIFOXYD2_FULL_39_29]OGF55378.1 MAG: four helix bundle protein [Candidatus Firestonebacteria bacterium RIFOXYC2_FULL_39_67]OGF56743.1 MAG: four helix bundle protein [Candidatus Firestonebacteria bacterium RifOxyC12_full_39_7]